MFDFTTYSVLESVTVMEKTEEFSINYWGKDFDYTNTPKEKRSPKGKMKTIALFLALVILTPTLILNLEKVKFPSKKAPAKQAVIVSPVKENQIASINSEISGTVEKNDNYWTISKRYCGTGIYYLSIQEKNNFKPLYEGDPVTVICR